MKLLLILISTFQNLGENEFLIETSMFDNIPVVFIYLFKNFINHDINVMAIC